MKAGEAVKVVLGLLFVLALGVGAVGLSCVHYQECRRVHPWWYCAGDGGRR